MKPTPEILAYLFDLAFMSISDDRHYYHVPHKDYALSFTATAETLYTEEWHSEVSAYRAVVTGERINIFEAMLIDPNSDETSVLYEFQEYCDKRIKETDY